MCIFVNELDKCHIGPRPTQFIYLFIDIFLVTYFLIFIYSRIIALLS